MFYVIVVVTHIGAFATSDVCAVDPAVFEAQQRRVAVVQRIAPTVVAIFARGAAGSGSGVLISADGFALTNFHVTSSVGAFMKCGLNDGVLHDAVIVGIDPTGDVALIKLLGRDDFPHAKLGDSDKLQVGNWAYAMGNPFMLATNFQPTVTFGIISGLHRYQYPTGTFLEYADCIQVDTSINPGNSGGPLFNEAGELIGINGRGSFEKRGRVNSGAGYAISINQIKHFMDCLRGGRIVDHATLGATVTENVEGLVVVDNILEQSEVYRRGLRVDDEIVSFAGRSIRSVNQFKNILAIYPKYRKLPLVYRNEGKKEKIYVRLRGLHRSSEMTPQRRRSRTIPKPEDPDRKKPSNKNPNGKDPDRKQPNRFFPAASNLPENHKHLYVKKEGFANYYFNTLEQQRTLTALKELGDFSQRIGIWSFSGTIQAGYKFEFTLADKGLGLEIGDDVYFQPLDGSNFTDEPERSGGLLLALYHLKLFLTRGDAVFTEFYYLGSEPLDGHGEKVDVIVTLLTGVESRWYFSRKRKMFVGFDTRLESDIDECEIRFAGSQTFDGRKLPQQLIVRCANRKFASFDLETVNLAVAPPKSSRTDRNDQ